MAVALELARTRTGPDADAALDRLEREAGRLDELIGRLLLLERLEAGEAGGEPVEIDLAELLGEVSADAGFEADGEGTKVQFETIGSCRVVGRPELLRSAFDNIIRNAVHYTRTGTVVAVAAAEDGDGVVVTVRDHGPGVAADRLDRIFEPFFRVDEARDRVAGGAGLGLAIAARAIRAHGGSISAANHRDGGLVVTVRLPR